MATRDELRSTIYAEQKDVPLKEMIRKEAGLVQRLQAFVDNSNVPDGIKNMVLLRLAGVLDGVEVSAFAQPAALASGEVFQALGGSSQSSDNAANGLSAEDQQALDQLLNDFTMLDQHSLQEAAAWLHGTVAVLAGRGLSGLQIKHMLAAVQRVFDGELGVKQDGYLDLEDTILERERELSDANSALTAEQAKPKVESLDPRLRRLIRDLNGMSDEVYDNFMTAFETLVSPRTDWNVDTRGNIVTTAISQLTTERDAANTALDNIKANTRKVTVQVHDGRNRSHPETPMIVNVTALDAPTKTRMGWTS